MRVLQIIDNLHPGGAERVMVNLCNWLDEVGINIVAILINGDGKELLDSLSIKDPVQILQRRRRYDISAAIRLASLLRNADIAHVHMRHNYRYVKLIAMLFGVSTPILFHDHFGKIMIDRRVPIGFRSSLRPQHYIGVSKDLTRWAIHKLKMSEDRVFLLENVVEKLISIEYGKVADLVLVSNIKPQKNQLFALEIVSESAWTLDLYGRNQDETYARRVADEILRLKVNANVKLISQFSEVQTVLNKYSLGLHTSISETGPLVIIEYLAQGLPFLAYRTGEAAEIISKEFPEFFLDNFDVEAWRERITLLLTTTPDRDKMSRVFEKYFSKHNYVAKCLKVYQSVLRF